MGRSAICSDGDDNVFSSLRDVVGVVAVRVRRDHGDERQVEGVQGARRLPQRGGGSDGDQA